MITALFAMFPHTLKSFVAELSTCDSAFSGEGNILRKLNPGLLAAVCIFASLSSPAGASTPLTYGIPGSGTISSAAQINAYTFSANAGDVVDFTATTTSGTLSPKLQLYNSNGVLLSTAAPLNINGVCTGAPTIEMNAVKLAAAGTYILDISDCSSTNTGNYELYAQSVNNPGEPVSLSLGSANAGVIASAAQSNTFTFSANAGDQVDFTLATASGSLSPKIRLYNSAGTEFASAAPLNINGVCTGASTVELNTVTLPSTGTYTALVGDCGDTSIGDYEIYAQLTDNPSPPITPLLFGQAQAAQISAQAQSNTYTFTASANDVVDFTLATTKGSLSPKIRLYNPAGVLVSQATPLNINGVCTGASTVEMNSVTLSLAGTYTVLVGDCSDTNQGNYDIYSQRINNLSGAANLPFGQTQSGLVGSSAQSVSYTFTASANDVVDFTLATTSGTLSPKLRLYGPTNALLSTATPLNINGVCTGATTIELNAFKLSAGGTYTVLVGDCGDANTGNYEVYMQRTNNPAGPTPVFWGQVQAASVSLSAQSLSYDFVGTAGNTIDLTATTTSGSLSPKLRLYNPDGTLLKSVTPLNINGVCTGGSTITMSSVSLAQNGTYTLLVGDCGDTSAGDYNLSSQCFGTCPITPLMTWPQPAAITYGTALSATQLDAVASIPGVTFTGNYAYTPSAGTVLTAGTQTLSVTFTPDDTTDYTSATASVQIMVNKATPTCTWATPAAIVYGTALSGTQLDASCTWSVGGTTVVVPGTFVYSPAAGTVLTPGSQSLSAIFTPNDMNDYTVANATTQLTVTKAPLTVTATDATRVYGAANPAFTGSVSGNVNGDTFTVSGTTTATQSSPVGEYPITPVASGADLADYTVTAVNGTLSITQATPSITWSAPAPISYGTALSGTQLNASSPVSGSFTYSPIAGTVLPAGSQTLTATFTPTDTTDYTGATASVTLVVNAVPIVSLSTNSLSFGSADVGTSSSSQSFILTNTGDAALSLTSIAVTGANASSFVFANNCGTSLAAGANCTIHGHFAPTTTGALTASITISDNASGSPQSVTLTGTGTTPPAVSLSANSLTFGIQTAGTSSASQSVTLTNTGIDTLNITSIAVTGANASSFVFTNNCGTSLAGGANCTIHGSFEPTAAGQLTAAITITDNAAGSPQSISLSGIGGTTVSLSATALSFGTVTVGSSSASQSVTLTNTGTVALNIASIAVTGANASSFVFANSCGSTLAAGANCIIHGHFAPTVGGALSASILITDNASTSPQSIALSGTGVVPPVTLSATSLWFGSVNVGMSSNSQSVTMTNTGTAALSITNIAVTGANASSFVFANNCGSTLAVAASCIIHGHFAPTTGGTLNAAITVTDNASDSPQSIALSGIGVVPPVTLSANSLTFPSTTVGAWSASQHVTVTNTGTAALSISSITVTGTNATSFVFANNCGTSLAVGANCIIQGHFQPTAAGTLNATITIADSATGSPQSIALSGIGVVPPVTLSATSLAFGSVNVGSISASQHVTITNTGSAALSITSITVTGTNPTSFVFANNCGTSLAVGASCIVQGHFGPMAAGALNAAITITDSATGSPQSVALSGTGVAPTAPVTLSFTNLSFGTITVGTSSASQSVTMTNTGTAALTITTIAVTGTNASEFVFANNCGTSLAVGANCIIHGHFAPTATGAATAAVTITDSAAGSPQSIALSGTGQ